MKKDLKSDLKVKNWQEPINLYGPDDKRVRYLCIPGILKRIRVTEEFYKIYKSNFWNSCKNKMFFSYYNILNNKNEYDFCGKRCKYFGLCKKIRRIKKVKEKSIKKLKTLSIIKKIILQIIIDLIISIISNIFIELLNILTEFIKYLF